MAVFTKTADNDSKIGKISKNWIVAILTETVKLIHKESTIINVKIINLNLLKSCKVPLPEYLRSVHAQCL